MDVRYDLNFGIEHVNLIEENLFISEDTIAQRYLLERKLMVLVANGDFQQAVKLFESMPHDPETYKDFIARNPESLEECARDIALFFNTGLRIVLVLNNVPVKIIHGLATYYGRLIKSASTEILQGDKLFYGMLRTYCAAAHEFAHDQYSAVTEKIVSYILSNLSSELSLKQISEKFSYSPAYINRILKKETGYTTIQFIKQKRISLAKMLLNFDDMSIEQIALQVGYPDCNYFCRVFRQVENTSPAQYREALTNEDILGIQ